MDMLEPLAGSELMQYLIFGEGANESYYSYEDLPSNEFSDQIDLDGKEGEELFKLVEEHLESACATVPCEAPNWEQIPEDDQDRKRLPETESLRMVYSPIEKTNVPKMISEPRHELLSTGNYIPQNRTSKAMNLQSFDAANTSIQQTMENE